MQICIKCIKVDRKTRMIPCYTCLEQSTPADPARQSSSTLGHPRIAHRLYSITTATYKHLEAIMHRKQKI